MSTAGTAPPGRRAEDRPAPLAGIPAPALAAVVLPMVLVQALLSGRYGYHRDELYFLVAGRHLAWGYVDQPPLTPALARLGTAVFGDTPTGLRVIAVLAYAAIVVVIGLLARELGGGQRAQVLAAAAGAVSAMPLSLGHMVSTATFDVLAWLVVCLLVARVLRTGDGRWYLAVGVVAGLGVLNKYLVVLLVAGLLVSLLLVGPRRSLATWWLPAGIAVAVVLVVPTLVWQARHGWPQLTIARGIDQKQGFENRISFIPFQFIYLAPPFVPIWIAGWLRLWRDPALRWARVFAVVYPLLALGVLVAGGKFYYVIPLLVVLLAAGAEPAVRWAARGRRGWTLPAALVLSLAVNAVATLPVLPVRALDPVIAVNKEQGEQVGWGDLTHEVALAWRRIPESERSRAVIFTQNYGEAAAIARFGPAAGLPAAYSGHMSYYDWGPPPDSANGPVLIVRYADNKRMPTYFRDCIRVGTVRNAAGISNDENGSVIERCAGVRNTWSRTWPLLRAYY